MTQESSWYIPNRVVYLNLSGDISMDDAIDMGKTNLDFLNAGEPPVHFIIDATEIGSAPLRLSLATEASSWVKHDNIGWVVIVGMSGFPKFLLTVIHNTLRFKMGNANSIPEAVEWLTKNDATLLIDESGT